ncbi:hypothetical protein BK133_00900 [Paenibacillus sp. FSL H8-0548]|uniref:YopX family protein n=1 Tax=Paenibacillus sp. FSL H8-0548 TaxID=1920422 RepID=UPI00096C59B5|nr:YopX family protein [Paenibacillus sp. FSL H8-0548]OMF38792.1 hypothetical protein BK133_00900 [Paenibacillus sp. FSL H8-0548]
MREIKFRGKRIDNGEWLYGDLVHNNEQVLISPNFTEPYEYPEDFDCNVLPRTVGQYTGLKNRAGVELYEGDIVVPNGSCGGISVQPYAMLRKHATGEMFIISHLPCGWALRHASAFGKSSFDIPNSIIQGWKIIESYTLWNHQGQMDVIGNIHDNADLLHDSAIISTE